MIASHFEPFWGSLGGPRGPPGALLGSSSGLSSASLKKKNEESTKQFAMNLMVPFDAAKEKDALYS